MKFEKPLMLAELAKALDAEYEGNPRAEIYGVNEIHRVEAGDLTFVDHPKYYSRAIDSEATTILINKKVKVPKGKNLLISDDPFRDYNLLVKKYKPFVPVSRQHSETAEIGEGTIIQPNTFIGNHVKIGKNCLIHANVSIYDHCIIGDNVIIHANTVLGADAYYFQKREDAFHKLESCGRVIIGDNVEIGALCAIDRGVSADTIIAEGTKMDNHCQVGHDTHIGRHCLIGAHAAIAGVTKIEDEVILWGRVAVNKDVCIGKGAVILATSAVSKSLRGGKTYFGAPAIEARQKWKEMAAIRKLPEIIEEL